MCVFHEGRVVISASAQPVFLRSPWLVSTTQDPTVWRAMVVLEGVPAPILNLDLRSVRWPSNLFLPTRNMKGCDCINRRTIQVSQTRRWVSPIDYTDGDRTAPKLDGVTKHFLQDEGRFYPHTIWPLCNRFHIVTVVSVEEELTWIWIRPQWSEWMGYRITHPTF